MALEYRATWFFGRDGLVALRADDGDTKYDVGGADEVSPGVYQLRDVHLRPPLPGPEIFQYFTPREAFLPMAVQDFYFDERDNREQGYHGRDVYVLYRGPAISDQALEGARCRVLSYRMRYTVTSAADLLAEWECVGVGSFDANPYYCESAADAARVHAMLSPADRAFLRRDRRELELYLQRHDHAEFDRYYASEVSDGEGALGAGPEDDGRDGAAGER